MWAWEAGNVFGGTIDPWAGRISYAFVQLGAAGVNIRIGTARSRADSLAPYPWLERAYEQATSAVPSPVAIAALTVDILAVVAVLLVAQIDGRMSFWFLLFSTIAVWGTGLRSGRLAPRVSEEIPHLVRNIAIAMLGFGLVVGPATELGVVVRLGVILIAFVALSRAFFYDILGRLRNRGIALERAVIVGAGPTAVSLAAALDEHPECGLAPAGFVDEDEPTSLPLPYLGGVTDLSEIMERLDTRYAIFAFGAAREYEMVSIIRQCDPRSFFYVLFRFFELGTDTGSPSMTANLAGFPVRRIHSAAVGSSKLWIKRMIDVVVASVGIILFAPIMVICAALVRLSSPGPVLFRQARIGRDGKEFDILKFRTMTVNADSDVTWSVDNDNRVTKVGQVLRTTHLDELPQLWNVLRGEMSLVGPRPERPFFVDQFGEQINGYHDRHRVKAGITGWSQVNGLVGDSSIEERSRNDNWYIERWTLWADIVIVLRTIPTMFRKNP